ncbi:MAG: glycoside hydrolase family 18 protein [Bacteroidetes bacterium]|nr:glycoside hydrolase family 18 protein [Bacteroidota bacterium]
MKAKPFLFLVFSAIIFFGFSFRKKPPFKKVIIGYVAGFRGLMGIDSIHAEKMTHINYAFAVVQNNRIAFPKIATDTINLANIGKLRNINPDVKLIISIGGWAGSKNFSDVALTDTSRENFAISAVDVVRKYDLDGIDIDWEYPGMTGAGNIYREEDKHNYTLMLKALRDELNKLYATDHKHYFLTVATGADMSFIEHTEMNEVQKYLDYVNLMTYDFRTEDDSLAGHHTNLFSTPQFNSSMDLSVKNYIEAGVPANKIVAGVAFYGRAWKVNSADNNGLNGKVLKYLRGGGFTKLKDSVIDQNGNTSYWDNTAQAPYLFNSSDSIFLSYDNERSIKKKCAYIKQKQLAGIMFWEYFGDYKCYLLDVVDKELR